MRFRSVFQRIHLPWFKRAGVPRSANACSKVTSKNRLQRTAPRASVFTLKVEFMTTTEDKTNSRAAPHHMRMWSTPKFAAWAVLVSLGFFCWMWTNFFTMFFFWLSWWVGMPREELHAVVPRREIWATAFALAIIVTAVIAWKTLVPAIARQTLDHVLGHPAVVIPLWLFCLWTGFRAWRGRRHIITPSKHAL